MLLKIKRYLSKKEGYLVLSLDYIRGNVLSDTVTEVVIDPEI